MGSSSRQLESSDVELLDYYGLCPYPICLGELCHTRKGNRIQAPSARCWNPSQAVLVRRADLGRNRLPHLGLSNLHGTVMGRPGAICECSIA